MNVRLSLLLFCLAALWGASFLFMRVGAPEFGPVSLIFIRMALGVTVLLPFLSNATLWADIRQNWHLLAILGIFNHVIPFTALSYATLSLESGFTSLINATTPVFTALVAAVVLSIPIRRQQWFGLVIAFSGIYILSADKFSFEHASAEGWAILAGLVATSAYAVSGNFAKQKLQHLSSPAITVGSMLASSIILIGPGLWLWPNTPPSVSGWIAAILLAVASTGVAFIIYFHILRNAGAFIASTVTLMVPVFAVTWGAIVLNEQITLRLLAGMSITLIGTALCIGLFQRVKILTIITNKRAAK